MGGTRHAEKVKRWSFLAVGAVACGRIVWNQEVGPTARTGRPPLVRSHPPSCGRTRRPAVGVIPRPLRRDVIPALPRALLENRRRFLRHLRHCVIALCVQGLGGDAPEGIRVGGGLARVGAGVHGGVPRIAWRWPYRLSRRRTQGQREHPGWLSSAATIALLSTVNLAEVVPPTWRPRARPPSSPRCATSSRSARWPRWRCATRRGARSSPAPRGWSPSSARAISA